MIEGFLNAVRQVADIQGQSRAAVRHGIITGYDPTTHAVKVTIQPEDIVTGWLPLKAIAVGPNWGAIFAPTLGEQVEVSFQEDDSTLGTVGLRFFTDDDTPPQVPAGEWWLIHKDGASVKFTADGKLTLTDASGTVLQLSNDGKIRGTGDLIVSGKIQAGEDITTAGDVKAGTVSLKNHLHTSVSAGSSLSGKPQA